MTLAGERGQLSVDTLVGLRLSGSGVAYAGPIGFLTSSASEDSANNNQTLTTTSSSRTLWLAPSADYFVIDHLSVGGFIEVANTATSIETKGGPVTTTVDLPSTTSFTLMPRVGYLIPIGERFGVWPRGGVGYFSRQTVSANVNNNAKQTFSAVGTQIQVPFLFRITETFYLHASPDLIFTFGGSSSTTNNANTTVSFDARAFQFGLFSGLGALIDL